MASQLYDALVSSMTARMDPERQKAASWLDTQIEESKRELVEAQAGTVARIRKLLVAARAEDEPDDLIIDAYERLLVKATA